MFAGPTVKQGPFQGWEIRFVRRRIAGLVTLPQQAFDEFIDAFERAAVTADDTLPAHSMTLIGDMVTHTTGRSHGDTRALTCARWQVGRDYDGRVTLAVYLEQGADQVLGKDILSIAGMPLERASYILSGRQARSTIGADRPREAHEFRPAFVDFLARRLSSVIIFVRTDQPNATGVLRSVATAVPPLMRPILPTFEIHQDIAEVCDQFLADHNIAALPNDTASILMCREGELTEFHRVAVSHRFDGRRFAMRLYAAMEQVAEVLGQLWAPGRIEIADQEELVELGERVQHLEQEVESQRAENARLEAELGQARDALAMERRRMRDLAHAAEQPNETDEAPTEQARPRAPVIAVERSITPVDRVPRDEPEPPTPFFATFGELLEHAESSLDDVVLSPSVWDPAAELDAFKKAALWRNRTWAALTSMQSYASQRAAGGPVSLRAWLEQHPSPPLPPTAVTSGETRYTAASGPLREARMFPVPHEVDPAGTVFMGQHIRIDPGGSRPAPRLHFYDDTSASGRVYVGYVGKHLRTRRHGT